MGAEVEEPSSRLGRLQAITEAALAHLALDDLLDEMLTRLRVILGVDTAAILLHDPETNEVVARAAKGLEEEVEAGVRIPVGRGFAGRVMAERRRIFLPDVATGGVLNPILIEKGVKSMLGVPLVVEGEPIGVLHVGSLTPRTFDDEDSDLLQAAADRMALAIDHARLYEAEREARVRAEKALDQLRRLQSVTDVALGHFSLDEGLLVDLLGRLREVMDLDTAAVLLLDTERQELVARAAKGLEEEVEREVRIPIGVGFAGRVARERRPVVVPDVEHSDVVNPILRERGVRSLLGVPLMVEGRFIGVLHVGTLEPREFSGEDIGLLERAADRIAIATDRARQHSLAGTLQRTLLPTRLPDVPGLSMAARYKPGVDEANVGGDWYDVIPLARECVGIAIGDVVSRGVRAATAMGQLRTALRAYAAGGDSPGEVLTRLNRLVRSLDDREMATVGYMVLKQRTHELTYCLAGHPPPLVVSAGGDARYLTGARSGPIGVNTTNRFAEAHATLAEGDTIVLYTDGLVERRDEPLDTGLERLRELVVSNGHGPDDLCERLVTELHGTSDDVAVLAVRIGGVPGEPLELTVHATPESLSSMRRAMQQWLTRAGANEDEAYDVLVAVGEAAANAVEHAYGPGDATFRLDMRLEGGEIVVELADQGSWRPPRGENRGRGLTLMHDLMDSVDVQPANGGTVVRMRRKLVGEETG